jgi:hypothetical protein
MNTNEPFRNVLNISEAFGSVPQSSEAFGDLQNTSKRTSGVGRGKKYDDAEIPDQNIGHDFVIMEQAYALFESQGERRSMRSIGQYCKTGELVCVYDSDDKRWHITRESIDQKIQRIKDLNARRAATAPQQNPQPNSEPFTEPPAAPQRPQEYQRPKEEVPPQNESDSSPFAVIKKLRKRILNLRILNQGKDYLITQLQEERGQLLTRIETSNRLVGELKHQLLQLEGPKRQTADAETPFDHAVPYRDVADVSSLQPSDPTPSMSPNEPLPHNTNTYEQSPQ